MHRHRDKNRTTPFIGNSETGSQNEQRRKGGEMSVRGGEKQGVEVNAEKTTEITLEYAVKKTPKKKFVNHLRDRHRENNDHDSLFDRVRAIDKNENALPAATASKRGARRRVGAR